MQQGDLVHECDDWMEREAAVDCGDVVEEGQAHYVKLRASRCGRR